MSRNRNRRRKRRGTAAGTLVVTERPTVALEDGTVGYLAARSDDCFRAAIATAAQIPIEQVPDPRLDERVRAGEDIDQIDFDAWGRISAWLDRRGMQLVVHDTPPWERERWIGIRPGLAQLASEFPDMPPERWYSMLEGCGVAFDDHCLIMSRERVIFDPAVGVEPPPGMRLQPADPSKITYGITIDPKEP